MKYINNEWMKLWSKKGTWAMLILTILLVIIPGIMFKVITDPETTPEQRKAANEKDIKLYQSFLDDEDMTEEDKAYFYEQKMLSEYRIEHDLPSPNAMTFDQFMSACLSIGKVFILIFVAVVAAGIVSQEFGTGTIKMLLTRPVARWKILLSKLFTSIIFGLLLYVVTIAFSALVGAILFGTDITIDLAVVDGVIEEQSSFENYLKTLGLSFGSFFMSIFFAFMIGSIFGSSSLAVGLTLVITFMGSSVVSFLGKYEFMKYIWFANDLNQYAPYSIKNIEDLTLGFSIGINVVYAIIFLAVSFIYFMKRDVTA